MEDGQAVAAVRAWMRLDRAFRGLNRHLADQFGVTGEQLALVRLIAADAPVTLAHLRETLAMHPAPLGQLVDRLVTAGLIARTADEADRRRKVLSVSAKGRELLGRAPVAGPVRLRMLPEDSERLTRLTAALNDAVELFGLEPYLEE